MKSNRDKILFFLFFISGFCGLLYQVIWLRLAYASFGVIAPVMSLVISIFMLGLGLGSWLGGRWITRLTRKTGMSAINFYALTELFIGLGAFAVPELFSNASNILLAFGEMDSLQYLLVSALLMSSSILPWCILMGFTFPFMMSFMQEADRSNSESFSFLYLSNVIGAMSGTLLTAFVLVELVGFKTTLHMAAILNFLIASISLILGISYPYNKSCIMDDRATSESSVFSDLSRRESIIALMILFTTGFTSMSMEVVWIRAYTPLFGNNIYSFASLLTIYLAATWAGSSFYRKQLSVKKTTETSGIITNLSVVSFFPILLNDPRLGGGMPMALLSIMPFCALLGYLTPKLIDQYSKGMPASAGVAYAVNIIGCIIGPILTSYVLLPLGGIKVSLIVLAFPYVFFFLYYASKDNLKPHWHIAMGALTFIFFLCSTLISYTYEEFYKKNYANSIVRRDHTATVVSYGNDFKKSLLTNGIGMTHLTPITKNMAHLPLSFISRRPESALNICFGMGTTYRSLMSWDIDVTAVELVPSVKDAFGFYFDDAETILKNPKGRIVIDDGRRFMNRTTRAYDVITIDPPPPLEAAGSSLLYSEEFYSVAKKHLKEGGILQQWSPPGEEKILNAVARSLINSFPYVKAFTSIEDWGIHFIASTSPIKTLEVDEMISRMPDAARKDLLEWANGRDLRETVKSIIIREINLQNLLNDDKKIIITDDKPFNEYCLLRRLKAS